MRAAAIAFYTCILVLMGACGQVAPSLEIKETESLNKLIDDYVDNGFYPVLYVRLEDRGGNVIYEHGAKNPTFTGDQEIDGSTWFRIWSMSKIVTISTVLDLTEEGILSLEDPVTKYIPEFENLQVAQSPSGDSLAKISNQTWLSSPDKDKASAITCPMAMEPVTEEMTIRDLINHEAGFYYATTNIPCLDEMANTLNLARSKDSEELISRLATLPLIQQPGADYFYGTNTTVLGLVAERATGRSLKELVEERVTGALSITGLQYGQPDGVTLLPRVSGADGTLRLANDGELDIFGTNVPDYELDNKLYLGGEGMLGTADGYADFLRMLLARGELNGRRVLNDKTITDMTAPHTQKDSDYGHNGYNLWINSGKWGDNQMGRGGLWIGGGYEGTHFWIDPEYGFVGVVMSQVYAVPPGAGDRDGTIREAIYDRLWVNGKPIR